MQALRLFVLCSALGVTACGSSGSGSGVAAGGASGAGATAGTGGGGGSGGSGGSGANAGTGGAAGSTSGGSGGTGAVGQWTATPEWTSLPIPLQFGPVLAPHPTNGKQFSVLATTFSVTGSTLVAATTTDLGSSFPMTADLTALPQNGGMGDPQGIAYNPQNPQEISAILWVQGPETDPLSGGRAYRSTDGGQSFLDTGIDGVLPMNSLAFSGVRYTSDGTLAIRTGASVVYTQNGSSVSDTVSTEDCSAQPGGSAFDVNPDDGKQVAVPCGDSIALCTSAGCVKKSVGYAVVDVRYGFDGQHLAVIGHSGNDYAARASVDGGNTFGPAQVFSDNVSPSWRVDWDPRSDQNTVYALLVDHVFRSTNGGASWEDITPPQELNYVYDFVVAADGTLVARGVFHYLLFSPG